jgi:hypothetical protein
MSFFIVAVSGWRVSRLFLFRNRMKQGDAPRAEYREARDLLLVLHYGPESLSNEG